MHTIIINTLGNALRQNPLFYLPFRAERFHWMEKDLADIAQCPREIVAYQSEQGQRQGYHVILLVSLAQLESSQIRCIREVYIQILRAYLNQQFLLPLCQQLQHPPVGVSMVFMLKEMIEGDGNVEAKRDMDRIFGFTEDMQQLNTLALRDRNGSPVLDVTALFSQAIASFRASLEKQGEEPLTTRNYALEQLRRHLRDQVNELQECRYIPVGRDQSTVLNCRAMEFAPLTTDWDLCCLDMQLNLCEHLQKNLDSDDIWLLELTPHDPATLRERILLALGRVEYLRDHVPGLSFYEPDQASVNLPEQNLTGEIWEVLRAKEAELPGVKEAYADSLVLQEKRELSQQKEKKPGSRLRRRWLLMGLEKKRFEQYSRILEEQYAPEEARKQEKDILDSCAGVFGQWRRKVLNRQQGLPKEPTAIQLPAFDAAAHEKALGEAQRKWGEVAASQLEDYTDVRQEAEKVKAEFRKTYRLWPDGECNATSKFLIYSAVLAAGFLLQMVLPYLGITMGQEDLAPDRYAHLAASIGVFAALYGAGLLLWMHVMCKQLNRLTQQMFDLLQDSHSRRRQSIIRAVELYGTVFPQCTIRYEKLQHLREVHEENLQRNERYNTHMQMLSKAQERLYELATMLRMDTNQMVELPELTQGIDFERPPSDPVNVKYYVFMSEKWGEN